MAEMPALATVPDVDLVAAGTWNLSTGEATFTAEDLAAAVEASQCPAIGTPVIKLGHTDPRFDGEPAVGRVANMALAAEGTKITGDLAGMPGWLGPVMTSAYPNRSIEGAWDFQCQIGHVHPFVITALALLGTSMPGVGVLSSLADVAALYGVAAKSAPEGTPRESWRLNISGGAMPGTVLAAGVTTEDVRRAYYDSSSTPYSYWITEMQMDPPQLIVSDEATSKVYRVPVTIKGADITFGDQQEVEVEYVDVKAAAARMKAGKVAAAWASAASSREGVPRKAAWDHRATAGRLARLRIARAAIASDTDADENVQKLLASLDATLDEASELGAGIDRTTVSEEAAQALDLITAAEALADQLMELLGVYDPDDAAAGGPHGSYTGTHSHPHAALGSQAGDMSHDHSHAHAGDAKHNHAHAGAGSKSKAKTKGTGPGRKGGSDVEFTDEQKAALRAQLGLAEDAELDEAAIAAGVAALADKNATAMAAASRKLPSGVIAVEQEAWDNMNKRVQAGEAARAAQLRDQRDTVIQAAVRDGKLSPARRKHWERLWDADPDGTREVLAGLAKNVVPVDDIGSAGGSVSDELLDEEYRSLFPPSFPAKS